MAHPLTKLADAHKDSIWCVDWSGDKVVTGSVDQTVKIWAHVGPDPDKDEDTDSLRVDRKVEGYALSIISVVVHGQTNVVAASSMDGSISILDLSTGDLKKKLDCGPVDCWTLALDKEGKVLVTGSSTGCVNVWDVEKGKRVKTLDTRGGKFVMSVAVSQSLVNGQTLVAAGTMDGKVYVFDLASERLISTLENHLLPVRALSFSLDSLSLFSGGDDGRVCVVDTARMTISHALPAHSAPVNSLAVSPDGGFLVTGGGDAKVKVWDLGVQPVPTCVGSFETHKDVVSGVAFNEEGNRFVTVGGDRAIQMYALPKVL